MRGSPSNWSRPPECFDASGAFETCQVREGRIAHLKEHMERLEASLKTVGAPRVPDAALRKLIQAARGIKEGYVRIAVRRSGKLLIHPHRGVVYPQRLRREGVALRTVPSRWPLGETAIAQAKGSERLSGVLAKLEGEDSLEILRIGAQGYLTEGNVSNFFLVKKGKLMTSPAWLGVLEGLMRAQVLRAARFLRIPVLELPVTRHEFFNAEEAFLTNVLMGILPIRDLDGRKIGGDLPGPMTLRLMKAVGQVKK